jgi:hypothetical protein
LLRAIPRNDFGSDGGFKLSHVIVSLRVDGNSRELF